MAIRDPLAVGYAPPQADKTPAIHRERGRWINFGTLADQGSTTTASFNFASLGGDYRVRLTALSSGVASGVVREFLFNYNSLASSSQVKILSSSDSSDTNTSSTAGDVAVLLTSGELGLNNRLTVDQQCEIMYLG